MSKRWINTRVEYQWSDELSKLVQISKEGYWYEGEMALCDVDHTGIVTIHTGGTNTYGQIRGYNNANHFMSMRAGKSYGTSSTGFMTAGAPHVMSFVEHCYSQADSGWHWISSNGAGIGGSYSYEKAMHLTAVGLETFFNLGIKSGGTMTCAGGTFTFAGSSGNVEIIQPNNNDLRFRTNNTETLRIEGGGNSSFVRGNVGIGDTSPSYKLEVAGTFYASGSSIEYKKEVKPYSPPEGALMKLKPVQYKYKKAWKDFGKRYVGNSSKQLGLVAEDVAKVLPELAVTKTEDGEEVVRNVDYEKLTVLLVSEVQNLRRELNTLKETREIE